MEIDGIPVPKNYKSPLHQRGESIEEHTPRAIPTRQGITDSFSILADLLKPDNDNAAFMEYMAEKPQNTDAVFIYGRFIWDSIHTYRDGSRLIRVHLTALFASESTETLTSKYEDKYDTHRFSVDEDLVTGTNWLSDDTTREMPHLGQKLKVKSFTKSMLYRNECCQFTTRFKDLEFEKISTVLSLLTEKDNCAAIGMTTAPTAPPTTGPPATHPTDPCTTSSANVATDTATEPPIKLEPDVKRRKTS
ncbi:hypothetical protein L915_21707 [Phytophthora nicotianae]|uniref:Uncharacterized protein n=1 Tax=Phytophthora nicotianae TaxID=4792 RepID=W2FK24_PHYNI|nr:hypothetical protein L915_21707 [Phytophthora nicotianae]